jgi:hypothetical protein
VKYMEFCRHNLGGSRLERLMGVIDVSRSMQGRDWRPSRLAGAREAQGALVDAKAAHFPNDEVGIVCFSAGARTLCPPVPVGEGAHKLKGALARMRTDSSTNITAGLEEARKHLLGPGAATFGGGPFGWLNRLADALYGAPPQRPQPAPGTGNVLRIVLLTDGAHNWGSSPERTARNLKEAGVIIDCIGIGGSPEEVGERLLRTIASSNPDGSIRYCFIGDKEQLIKKYEQLANRLRWT